MTDSGDIRARLQLRAGAEAESLSAIWAGELRTLLAGIRSLNSLSAAAGQIGMEYRQAWRVIKRGEELFGVALTARHAGGRSGGGSSLTPEGEEVLRRLADVLEQVGRVSAEAFRAPPTAEGDPGSSRDYVVIASSTEPVETGLLDLLERAFLEDTGITLRHIATGSGQAHELAEHGRADAVLSHAPQLEDRFMERGIGVRRTAVMRNRYVLLGPYRDPAGLTELAGRASLADMFARLAAVAAPFVSRHDSSGTNLKELELWRRVGVEPADSWYHAPSDAGGSAAAVRCAVRLEAYTLVDSATAFRHIELRRFVPAQTPEEENVFSLLVVNSDRVPGANTRGASRLADWLSTDRARQIIASFGTPSPLFEPIP